PIPGLGVLQVGRVLELEVLGDASFEREASVRGAPGRFGFASVIAAVAMRNHRSGTLQSAGFGNAEYGLAVPNQAKLVVLVGVDAVCVFDETIGHFFSPLQIACDLLNADDHEFGGLQRSKANQDVDNS